ncbi:TIGR00282 family metallophosphoesterase [Mycoplasma phocimorsus]|uniref:TIGR00282 family metallophosphoesterase n=1 Tax=Mycoplasma phocimorsus TaxID=3045839 RepID=UPI0024C08DAC|nr:TIGR00282 family metallophosphoesterase [Mycoplasma phocimorsus]MDJ1646399.1 TIGR00282 family metallophosphoesterase [Mycoplasma phocimorsus]
MKKQENKKLKILFLGDIFGEPGIKIVEKELPSIIAQHKIDFVIAQAENVSGRKGFIPSDYNRLKLAGVNVFTLGNHVWANEDIHEIIENEDVIRPANISSHYPGKGTNIFYINNISIRITSLMGITFNKLNRPWNEEYADNFFDKIDEILLEEKTDFHFIDFHGETTSEKHVIVLYLDGKINGLAGTHTHVQTNDDQILPNGTLYISDAGMCGPIQSAIGVSFESVYLKMRYNENSRFSVSNNKCQINGVVMEFNTDLLQQSIYKIKQI